MVPTSVSRHSLKTKMEKSWPYYEYYFGEEDQEGRRHGEGVNHWTGAKSIEWHSGNFFHDTMHGLGDYCWCYRGRRGLFASYEGNFYVNSIHGYGAMSYPDGKVFTGLFNKDVRYGPGVESFACRRENVGLWRGIQLVRVSWRPAVSSVIPELNTGAIGKSFVNPHRIVLRPTYQTFGIVNSALELLKECGSHPTMAAKNWPRLYPKFCTDTASALCNVEMFDNEYYNGKVFSLKQEDTNKENYEYLEQEGEQNLADICSYYAWNNNEVIIDMMKHCFKHEWQRENEGIRKIDLKSVLSGPRKNFQRPAMHELDSRTLLMAAYLGHISSTTFLVNERGVDPNISDIHGNTAVMYAACGNEIDIVNFLVEAGADVDSFNDSCCTALGIALMRFACVQADVPAWGVVQAMLPPPPPATSPDSHNISEWNINRDIPTAHISDNALQKSPSKYGKVTLVSGNKSKKSLTSIKDNSGQKKKESTKIEETGYDSDVSLNDENKLYIEINHEYVTSVKELFSVPNIGQRTYLFNTRDMVKEVLMKSNDEPQMFVSKPDRSAKKPVPSKSINELNKKPGSETMCPNYEAADKVSQNSADVRKTAMLQKIKLTIHELLELGASPRLVRCPQPALLIAIMSGSPDIVSELLKHGANANEINPEMFGYSMLDVAIAQPLTYDNYRIIEALLQGGARADRRLPCADSPQLIHGPTLLHAVLARKVGNDEEVIIRKQMLEVLLDYKCDPLAQFKGRSAFEDAARNMDLLDIVLKSPSTDLNGVINDSNQTILVKMFSMPFFKTVDITERLQTLTNLLLFGADPLMKCRNQNKQYRNLFEFAKKILFELKSPHSVKQLVASSTIVKKGHKKDEKVKGSADESLNYRQAIDLVRECARILHIRWLQGKLTKELVKVIYKYKHRPWPMILKEHKNQIAAGLWLLPQRCLDIWALLKSTKRKKYNDKLTLKYLLCMVQFYSMRSDKSYRLDPVTSTERDMIDDTIACMLKEHKEFMRFDLEMMSLKRVYVQPELFVNEDSKFDVCFECALPFDEERIRCESCNLVSFCSLACMKENVERVGCHPCSEYLKAEFLSTPSRSNASDGLEEGLK